MNGKSREPLESDPVIDALKKEIDITLIRENLQLTPHERIVRLMELQRVAEELERVGRELRSRTSK